MFNYLKFNYTKSRFLLCCATAVVLICSSTTPSQALDGLIDLRGYRQGGRAGDTEYTTENFLERYSLDQRVSLAQATLFQIRYSFQRDNLWSAFGGSTSKSRKVTQGPFLMLSFRGQKIRAGVTGHGIRKETYVPNVPTRTDDNLTSSAYARTEIGKAELNARYLINQTKRTQEDAINETRNTTLGFIANYDVSTRDRFRYSLNNTSNKGITLETEAKYLSNILQYVGNHTFDENRGRFNIDATVSRFDQSNLYGSQGTREYLPPVWGGFLLDDTPQDWDPLEPDPVQDRLLYDNDLVTPTTINIGNSASVVREFGGDYRNIILDFGDPTVMDSIALHIDTQLNFPGLIQWLVYVSDDPEGRIWSEPLTPDVVTVEYEEWEFGRQGWEVRMADPITYRWVKLVNVKFGVTEPDIFITEMEVFSVPREINSEIENTLNRYRLNGDIKYDILQNWEVNYRTDLYEQRSTGGERNLSGAAHQAGSTWRPGKWDVTGHYQVSTLEGASRYKTDVNSQLFSVARRFTSKIDARIYWRRTEDNSTSLNYTTNDVNLDFNWRIAPGLYFNQRLGRGTRSDHLSTREAEAWVHTSIIRANPVRALSLELRRMDRWASENAGSGFSNFNNTELITRWSIMPLLAYYGQMVYQEREGRSDWSARNQLSWNPMPGGNMEVSFNVVDYRDTRIDIVQQSAGVNLTWQVRSNAKIEFGAETVNITLRGETNRPNNLYARGRLNF